MAMNQHSLKRPDTNVNWCCIQAANKRRNVEDHISVTLLIAETDSIPTVFEVRVDFRLFLLDQNKRVYSVFEDPLTRKGCFTKVMLDAAGFDKLISIEEFTDASNGYLVGDTCVFGAEVCVCEERRTGNSECLSRVKVPCHRFPHKHVWMLDNFSM